MTATASVLSALLGCLLVATLAFDAWLSLSNLRHGGRRLAEADEWVRETVGVDEPGRLRSYLRATTGLSLLNAWLSVTWILVALYTGLLADVVGWLEATGWPLVVRGGAFFLLATVASWLLSQPTALFEAFVVDELFGLADRTPGAWLRGAVLNFAVSGGTAVLLGAGIVATISALGAWWWVATLLLYVAVVAGMQVVYPRLVVPALVDLEPLPDGPLRDDLRATAERAGVEDPTVLVTGGGAAGSGAFVAGFGSAERVVVHGALLDGLDRDEVRAVLAHELAHSEFGHVPKRVAAKALRAALVLVALHLLLSAPVTYTAFGLPAEATYAGLVVAGLWAYPLALATAPLRNRFTRRQEHEADAFAAEVLGDGEAVADAIAALVGETLSNPFPHPLYAAFKDGHPSVAERIERVRARATEPARATDGARPDKLQ